MVSDLAPGQGELFCLADKVYEYIPNVTVFAESGSQQYYGHERGVVLVNRRTGRRAIYKDGDAFTPVSDLAISDTHVLVAQDNGTTGNVVRLERDLNNPIRFCTTTGRPTGVSVNATGTFAAVVDRTSATTSRVRLFSGPDTQVGMLTFNDGAGPYPYASPYVAYDVQYQEGLGSFVVAHGRFYSRFNASPPFPLLNRTRYRTAAPMNVRLAALGSGSSQWLFAGRNEGAIGGVEKLNSNIVRPSWNGWWPAGGTEPSVKSVAAAGNHVLFCSTSPGGDFFVRLRAVDLWSLGYRATSAPRSVGLAADSSALMASAPGVARSSEASLAGQYLARWQPRTLSAQGDSQVVEGAAVMLNVWPNPVVGEATIQFTLPHPAAMDLSVFDVLGRRVLHIAGSRFDAGTHRQPWIPRTKGIYLVRLRFGPETRVQKVAVR
jgi:hypothetical protein